MKRGPGSSLFLLKSLAKRVFSGPVSWVFTHGTEIPQNALVCGEDIDGSPLYVCRTFHRGGVRKSLVPNLVSMSCSFPIDFGKAGPGFKTGAMFGYGCKEIEVRILLVLRSSLISVVD